MHTPEPPDEYNRALAAAVRPADWVNPEPAPRASQLRRVGDFLRGGKREVRSIHCATLSTVDHQLRP